MILACITATQALGFAIGFVIGYFIMEVLRPR